MDGQEDGGDEGQDHDVEHVEPEQRVLADLEAAEDQRSGSGVLMIGVYAAMFRPIVIAQ